MNLTEMNQVQESLEGSTQGCSCLLIYFLLSIPLGGEIHVSKTL